MKRHPERYGKTRSFEDVWLWQQAPFPVRSIYDDLLTQKDFGFRDQNQRAGISIMNNISEGFERGTKKDFARHIDQVRGSAGEVRSMYYLAEDLHYVSGETAKKRRDLCRMISAGLSSLASYLRKYSKTKTKRIREDKSNTFRINELDFACEMLGERQL